MSSCLLNPPFLAQTSPSRSPPLLPARRLHQHPRPLLDLLLAHVQQGRSEDALEDLGFHPLVEPRRALALQNGGHRSRDAVPVSLCPGAGARTHGVPLGRLGVLHVGLDHQHRVGDHRCEEFCDRAVAKHVKGRHGLQLSGLRAPLPPHVPQRLEEHVLDGGVAHHDERGANSLPEAEDSRLAVQLHRGLAQSVVRPPLLLPVGLHAGDKNPNWVGGEHVTAPCH
mmetsp:Transcript_2149/g.7797  ORF Transcript_2149/g.7797 Transcript_2149/m.7797 type:complete len:225 (+) Transcript_2149:746-1420(+)